MTEATLSYAQEPTPSLLEPTGPELLVNNNGSSYSNISVGTPTVTTTGAAVTASTTSTSSSTFKRRISLRARTLSVTLPSPSRTTPSTPSPIKGESSELMTSTNAEQSRVALIRRVSEKKSKASTVDTDDSVFVADITTNPYISFVAKRIRSLKKRVARIESTEELLRSDPEIKDRMALEQLQSVERKLDATAPLREFEDLLKLMTDQHIKDKKSEAERFREAEKLREAARKYEEAEARREEAQRQTSVTSFIQLVRLFYALKELEGAEEHLEDNLLQSLCTLDMFRSKLFEAAEAAELTNEGSQRQRLYDFVMDMTSRSSKPVSDVGSLTFNDVLVELDNITNPSQKTQQRGSDDVEDDSDPQSKMASPELSPSKAEYTNAVVENWLDESQQQSALPLSTATPPISSSEKGLTEEIFASVEDIQATLQTTPHDQSTTVQGKANEEATRGGAKHPVMEGSNSRALIPAGSSASNGGHRGSGETISKAPFRPRRTFEPRRGSYQRGRFRGRDNSTFSGLSSMSTRHWRHSRGGSGGDGYSRFGERYRGASEMMTRPTRLKTKTSFQHFPSLLREDKMNLNWRVFPAETERSRADEEEKKQQVETCDTAPAWSPEIAQERQRSQYRQERLERVAQVIETREMCVQTDDKAGVEAESQSAMVSNRTSTTTAARRTRRQKRQQGEKVQGPGGLSLAVHQTLIDEPIPLEQLYQIQPELSLHMHQHLQRHCQPLKLINELPEGLQPSGLWYPPRSYYRSQVDPAHLYSPGHEQPIETAEETPLVEPTSNGQYEQHMAESHGQEDQRGVQGPLDPLSPQSPFDLYCSQFPDDLHDFHVSHSPHVLQSLPGQNQPKAECQHHSHPLQHQSLILEESEESGMPLQQEYPPLVHNAHHSRALVHAHPCPPPPHHPHPGHGLAHVQPYLHQQYYQQHPFYYYPGGYYPVGFERPVECSDSGMVAVHPGVGVSVQYGDNPLPLFELQEEQEEQQEHEGQKEQKYKGGKAKGSEGKGKDRKVNNNKNNNMR